MGRGNRRLAIAVCRSANRCLLLPGYADLLLRRNRAFLLEPPRSQRPNHPHTNNERPNPSRVRHLPRPTPKTTRILPRKSTGTAFYGLQSLPVCSCKKCAIWGQDGAGIATIKINPKPGTRYISRQRSNATNYLTDLFYKVWVVSTPPPRPNMARPRWLLRTCRTWAK